MVGYGVGDRRFNLGDMKDWMNGLHGVREMESARVGTCACDDLEQSEVLLRQFFRRLGGMEVLGLNKDRAPDLESRNGGATRICGALVTFLHVMHLLMEE